LFSLVGGPATCICRAARAIDQGADSCASGLQAYVLLETDACVTGIGGVLAQEYPEGKMMPIAYASRRLKVAETRYPTRELETQSLAQLCKCTLLDLRPGKTNPFLGEFRQGRGQVAYKPNKPKSSEYP